MANWQFSFYIVPKTNVSQVSPLSDDYYSMVSKKMDRSKVDFLKDMLITCEEKYEGVYYYGDEESNSVIAGMDGGYMGQLYVRFDLNNPSKKYIDAVLDFAKDNDMVLIGDFDVVFSPTINQLYTEIRKSDAFRFIRDPEGFFKTLEVN